MTPHGIFHPISSEVGEPTFTILTRKEAARPTTWLSRHGYRIPAGALAALKPYIKRHATFIAVHYTLPAATGLRHLRPFQVAFESPTLDLPLHLGRVNAPKSGQTLQLYTLTRTGRVTTETPRTLRPVADVALPAAILKDPRPFYDAATSRAAAHAGASLLEYAWEATWCDPCVATSLTPVELHRLGAYWVDPKAAPPPDPLRPDSPTDASHTPHTVFVTRLYLAYGAKDLRDDVTLVPTDDRNTLQTRFVIHQPYDGHATCDALLPYRESLPARRESEAETLSRLTGWDLVRLRRQLDLPTPASPAKTWVDDLWKD